MKKYIWIALTLIIVLPVLALGALSFKYKMNPVKLIKMGSAKYVAKNTSIDKTVGTIFLKLNVTKNKNHTVPVPRRGSGGALASFGDELLVLTHNGDFFQVRADDVVKLDIEAAANNLNAYVEASTSEKYKNLWHRVNLFRYNDVLVIPNQSGHLLLISYTEWLPDKECYGTALAKLEIGPDTTSLVEISAVADNWTVIFRTTPCLPLKKESAAIEGHMAGGRMTLFDEDHVVLGSGDYAWDGLYAPEILAQDVANSYGKIVKINVHSGDEHIMSFGHRNMQGIALDSQNKVWVVEHGPRGGDELNMSIPDGNFGWPHETLGTRYNALPWPGVEEVGRHNKYIQPKIAWVPSIAPSSMILIENFHPTWDGDFLVGAFLNGTLYRVRIQNEQVLFIEPIKIFDGRIRDIHQHTDGRLAVWTDDKTILFLTVSDTTTTDTVIEDFIEVAQYEDDLATRIKETMNACMECHSLGEGESGSGPNLGGIFGEEIASTNFPYYSSALSGVSGKWTTENLTEFIKSPQQIAPGTTMPDTGITDEKVVEGIVEIIKLLRTKY